MRGVITRSTRDLFPGDRNEGIGETTDETLTRGRDVVERWHGAADGRLRAWFNIRMSISASDDLIREIGVLARAFEVGVHTHAATTPFEAKASASLFGKSTLRRYEDLGLLGPNVCAVHMGCFDDEDLDLFVRSGASVAHCPVAAMTGAWGVIRNHRIPQLIERGVTVGIGSDTNCGSGTLDMFRQLFICATVHREAHEDPSLIGAKKSLEMATIGAAKALQWDDEIGTLEEGKKADLVVIDRSHLEWHYPGRDPVARV